MSSSILRYSGMLIFQGRVKISGSSMVAFHLCWRVDTPNDVPIRAGVYCHNAQKLAAWPLDDTTRPERRLPPDGQVLTRQLTNIAREILA